MLVKSRFDLKYENKSESSRSVVERYRRGIEENNWDTNLALVHYRGGEEEFQLGKAYLNSDDPIDRGVGADILGQLGWRDKTFLDMSVSLLISALQDKVDSVVYFACVALGNRCDERGIAHVIKLAQSPSTEIRNGVVFALLGQESAEAIDVMLLLSHDEDLDTRNWAMFGLGTQIEIDSPQIRQALHKGTADEDSEIRGEALVGLANRKDSSAIELLLNEWKNFEDVSILSVEAAEIIASPRLYSTLVELENTLDLEEDVFFEYQLQHALDACKPKMLKVV
jgi:HEAT repeat protein